MKIRVLACITILIVLPALAEEPVDGITLTPGHPIFHEREREAGVAMGLSLAPSIYTRNLTALCEELRANAALAPERDGLRIQTVFVVPRKDMAVEGYYAASAEGEGVLVRGSDIARGTLNAILGRAGIPAGILDETDVAHEVSCFVGEPSWYLGWYDVRPIGNEAPQAVIERARDRFMAVYDEVVEYTRQRHREGTGVASADAEHRR